MRTLIQSPGNPCPAAILFFLLVFPAAILTGGCQGGDVYNPGNPGSEEYYLTQTLLCALGDESCTAASGAGNDAGGGNGGGGGAGGCTQSLLGGNIIGCELSFANGVNVTTPYGPAEGNTTPGDADGTGNAASFQGIRNMTTDGTNIYVVDSNNNKIRQIVIATGVVTTLAGPGPGITTAGDDDGVGTAARFGIPSGITTDGTSVFVSEFNNNKIRRIDIATGTVTTLAGPAPGTTMFGDADGIGNAARFNRPWDLTNDGTNLYVVERNGAKVRQVVIATGAVTTLAGPAPGAGATGDDDGIGNAARFNFPTGITTDGTSLYVASVGNDRIRKIDIATREVTTLAGPAPGTSGNGDTEGIGNAARFSNPQSITTDGVNLYVSDGTNDKIRRIVIATGEVTTLAGPPQGTTAAGDTDAPGTSARFDLPYGLTTDGTRLYVADNQNNKIRAID